MRTLGDGERGCEHTEMLITLIITDETCGKIMEVSHHLKRYLTLEQDHTNKLRLSIQEDIKQPVRSRT